MPKVAGAPRAQSGDVTTEKVLVKNASGKGGIEEELMVDSNLGPLVVHPDGSLGSYRVLDNTIFDMLGPRDHRAQSKAWRDMLSTEKEIVKLTVAKKNMKLREWMQSTGGPTDSLPDYLSGWSDYCHRGHGEAAKQWLATGGAWPPEERKQDEAKSRKPTEAGDEPVLGAPWLESSPWGQASWGWMPSAPQKA